MPDACPGCGCEPEIQATARVAGEDVGYLCSCGIVVVFGTVAGAAY